MQAEARDYFVRRLNEIAQEKVQAKAVELFGPTGRPQQPTWGMVFEGIKSGEITLKADKVASNGSKVRRAGGIPRNYPRREAKGYGRCLFGH